MQSLLRSGIHGVPFEVLQTSGCVYSMCVLGGAVSRARGRVFDSRFVFLRVKVGIRRFQFSCLVTPWQSTGTVAGAHFILTANHDRANVDE